MFRRSTGDAPLRYLCGELDGTELAKSHLVKEFRQEFPLVIWFQCPCAKADQYSTAELLRMFVKSASTLNHPGGIVLVIGVFTTYDEKKYRILDLKKLANENGFKHLEDKNFIRECILYGYRHCKWDGTERIHGQHLQHHLSHIFIKEMGGSSRSGAGEE